METGLDDRTPKPEVLARHENNYRMIFQLAYHSHLDAEFLTYVEPLNVVHVYYDLLVEQKKAERDAMRSRK